MGKRQIFSIATSGTLGGMVVVDADADADDDFVKPTVMACHKLLWNKLVASQESSNLNNIKVPQAIFISNPFLCMEEFNPR